MSIDKENFKDIASSGSPSRAFTRASLEPTMTRGDRMLIDQIKMLVNRQKNLTPFSQRLLSYLNKEN